MSIKYNIIKQRSQVQLFGYGDNGLCYISVVTEGNNISSLANLLNNEEYREVFNLLNLQFKLKEDYKKFKLDEAKELILLQKNVKNKIILLPLESKEKEFLHLENYFLSLYKESYTLVLIGSESKENLKFLFAICIIDNKNISSVNIIENYSGGTVRKIAELLSHYGSSISIGIVNLRRYQGEQYLNLPPTIFYFGYGAKYFSYRDFSLDGGGGGERVNFYRFNEKTFLVEKLTQIEVEKGKILFGNYNKFYEFLRKQNLDKIYSIIEKSKDLNIVEIRELIEMKCGKKLF